MKKIVHRFNFATELTEDTEKEICELCVLCGLFYFLINYL
jgi:hypothetical protein